MSLVVFYHSNDVEIARGKERKSRVTFNIQSNSISLPVDVGQWPGGWDITLKGSCTVDSKGHYFSHHRDRDIVGHYPYERGGGGRERRERERERESSNVMFPLTHMTH